MDRIALPAPPTAPQVARAALRRMVALVVGASAFSCLFVLSFGYALHAPRPHHLRIDVVAAGPVAGRVRAALDAAAPGAFTVRVAGDAGTARRDVRGDVAAGALVVGSSGAFTGYVASAGGLQVEQTVVKAVTGVAAAEHRPAAVTDLVPLPPADRSGQSVFVLELGLLIPGVIGSVAFYLLGRQARVWVRVGAAVAYAVAAPGLGVLVLDGWLGALTGSPLTLWATGSAVAATLVLIVAALHALLGLPGTGVAAGLLLVVGNAVNGSTVPVAMLPSGYRQVAPWLPNAAAVRAFRLDVYFDGHGMAQPLLALGLWLGGALLALIAVDVAHLRQRRHAPDHHQSIHATSVVGQVRRQLRGDPVSPSPG